MTTNTPVAGLRLRAQGPLLVATLEAPGGNQMTAAMCEALVAVLREPPEDAHVLLLEARGEAFCLGRERSAATPEALPAEVARLVEVNSALAGTRLVTVARVQGDAAGFGAGLAALADVAIAVETASFWFPEIALGLAPTLVLAWLGRMVGRREAFWLTATGEHFSAARAVQLGMLNEVVADLPALDRAVERRIELLLGQPGRVHSEIRAMLRSATSLSPDQANELAADRLVIGSLRLSR